MKALILGDDAMIARMDAFLNEFGLEAVECSESSKAAAIASQQRLDIVLVDAELSEADAVCHQLHSCYGVPVVAITKTHEADWVGLQRLRVDGFMPLDRRSTELTARFRAILRRTCFASQSGDLPEGRSR